MGCAIAICMCIPTPDVAWRTAGCTPACGSPLGRTGDIHHVNRSSPSRGAEFFCIKKAENGGTCDGGNGIDGAAYQGADHRDEARPHSHRQHGRQMEWIITFAQNGARLSFVYFDAPGSNTTIFRTQFIAASLRGGRCERRAAARETAQLTGRQFLSERSRSHEAARRLHNRKNLLPA